MAALDAQLEERPAVPHPGNMRAGLPAGRWAAGRADVSGQPRGGPPPSLVAPAVAAGVFGQPGELVVRVPSLDVGAVLLGDLFLRVALRPRRGGRDGVRRQRPWGFSWWEGTGDLLEAGVNQGHRLFVHFCAGNICPGIILWFREREAPSLCFAKPVERSG